MQVPLVPGSIGVPCRGLWGKPPAGLGPSLGFPAELLLSDGSRSDMCLVGVLYSHMPYVPAKPKLVACIYFYYFDQSDVSHGTSLLARACCMLAFMVPMCGTRDPEYISKLPINRPSGRHAILLLTVLGHTWAMLQLYKKLITQTLFQPISLRRFPTL